MPAAHWFLVLLYTPSMEECAAWERERVLTASSKHSRPICLFVCVLLCNKARNSAASKMLLNNICSMSLPHHTATSGHIMTYNCGSKSIFSSISCWIVPLARVQKWTSAQWEVGEKMLEWIDGRDPMHFSNSPQSETDSQQLVWTNLKLYWLKTQ